MAETRYFPSIRQIINSTIVGIAIHPAIKNPIIYYPVPELDGSKRPVRIERYRDYDGVELEEPGLTCSVFPFYSSRTLKTNPSPRLNDKSVSYEQYTLGPKTRAGSAVEATYRLIVQLNYQDVAINERINVPYHKLNTILTNPIPHGMQYITDENVIDNINKFEGIDLDKALDTREPHSFIEHGEITVEINPGENILREYIDLIRIILDEMPTMVGWSIRSSEVKSIDFPTTSWLRTNTDVYFHSAWLLWELCIFAPTSWRDLNIPSPLELKLIRS